MNALLFGLGTMVGTAIALALLTLFVYLCIKDNKGDGG